MKRPFASLIRHLILGITLLVSSFQSGANEHRECQDHIYSFRDLADRSRERISNLGGINEQALEQHPAPALIQSALPKGARYLEKPLRQATPHRYYRPLGVSKGYTGFNVPVILDGKTLRTDAGASPFALVDNVWRHTRNEKKSLVSESARAVVVWLHGGGTNFSSWQNGSSAATTLGTQDIEVVSLDFFGHGNGPDDFFKNPEAHIRFVMEFMDQYVAPSKVPIILGGHSMGAMIADIISILYPKERLQREYPNLNLQAIAMLSPPADPTPEREFRERFLHDNKTREEDPTETLLTEANNINLPSQKYLLVLEFLHRWNRSLLKTDKERLPIFFAMGTADDLWIGKEELFKNFVAQRPNIKPEYFKIYSEGVDLHNNPKEPGHIIPAIFSPERPRLMKEGKKSSKDPRINHPQVFLDLLDFINIEVLGSTHSSGEYDNNHTNHALARVIDLWGSSSFFRSFVETYSQASRQTSQPDLVKFLVSRADSLASFGKIYFSELTEKPIDDTKNRVEIAVWKHLKEQLSNWDGVGQMEADQKIQAWYSQSSDQLRSSFIFDFFSNLEEPKTRKNRNLAFGVISVPDYLPGSNGIIRTAILSKSHNQLLSALKSISIEISEMIGGEYKSALGQNNPQGVLRDKIVTDLEILESKRSQVVREINSLYSRKSQLDRVFSEHPLEKSSDPKISSIWSIEDSIVRSTHLKDLLKSTKEQLESLSSAIQVATDFDKMKILSDDLLPLSLSLVEQFRPFVFPSYMGHRARSLLSEIHSIITVKIPNLQNILSQESTDNNFLEEKNSFIQENRKLLLNALDFCKEALSVHEAVSSPSLRNTTKLNVMEESVRTQRDIVFAKRDAFFEYRNALVDEWIESGVFGTEEQPSYPEELNQHIIDYELAQQAFQTMKSERNKIFSEEALTGNLGSLSKFIALELLDIRNRIAEIENNELHELEIEIQRLSHKLTAVQAEFDAQYSRGLFYYTRGRSVEFLSKEPSTPLDITPLQNILYGWRNIWREISGDQENLDAN